MQTVNKTTQRLGVLLEACSEIFFLRSPLAGLVLAALMLVLEPRMALAGVLCVLFSQGFSRLLGSGGIERGSGYFIYNPLLVGLSIGYKLEAGLSLVMFCAAGGISVLIITTILQKHLLYGQGLPVLSLPFAITSAAVYLALSAYPELAAPAALSNPTVGSFLKNIFYAVDLPAWASGYLKSLGWVVFMPHAIAGLLVLVVLCWQSRILALLSALGYYAGALAQVALSGSKADVFGDPYSFNFILVAMAVGGVYMVPSVRTYAAAAVAVLAAVLASGALAVLLEPYGVPVFTLPFTLTTITTIMFLRLSAFPRIPAIYGRTPEETLEVFSTGRLRFGQTSPLTPLPLPFSGQWCVWQGFDGIWTHKGLWRHAYDFVITDESGKTHAGRGASLSDYYAFGKPVLSPVDGRVVAVVSGMPDNPPGGVDLKNNWGNLVVINHASGTYVEISHFAQGSIRVAVGDTVTQGALLGRCGNSGYSPEPHIHMQVQSSADIGASTVPFTLTGFVEAGGFYTSGLPAVGSRIEPLLKELSLSHTPAPPHCFRLGDTYCYNTFLNGKKRGRIYMQVKATGDGTFYLCCNNSRLYFGAHEGMFYFFRIEGKDPWLRMFFAAMPSLPPGRRPAGLKWRDTVPVGVAASGPTLAALRFLGSFFPQLLKADAEITLSRANEITTLIKTPLKRRRAIVRAQTNGQTLIENITSGKRELRLADY